MAQKINGAWQDWLKKGEVVSCLALTEEDLEAIEMVKEYMLEAGLKVRQDAAGNLIGRKEGQDPDAKVLMIGSHIDTVYNGGMYDGRLGVVAGIEVVQVMKENNIQPLHPIEVWVYRDEEGTRFFNGLAGSSRVVGSSRPLNLDGKDKDGISLREALEFAGINHKEIHKAELPNNYAKAHLELHIEQGGVLESQDLPVGVVTGITSIQKLEVSIKREAAHAGATPMNLRHDALTAASEVIVKVEELARKSGTTVATIGRVDVYPGGSNIIPGKVDFTIDIRDKESTKRDEVIEKISEHGKRICEKRGVNFQCNIKGQGIKEVKCADEIQNIIETVCNNLDIPTMKLPSGAGHDSMHFADFCEEGIGMIFVRSIGGISHSPKEYSLKEDCIKGTKVLYQVALELAR